MLEKLNEIQAAALDALKSVTDDEALQAWRVANVGRSSPLMLLFKEFGKLTKEERPVVGQRANQVKVALEAALTERAALIKEAALARSLEEDHLDVTLPGRPVRHGGLHPATQTLRRITDILADMGFQVYTSREVESDEYNFQHLNFPVGHPAREMQDSFYIESDPSTGLGQADNPLLMRTHTSPGQIRAMRQFAATDPNNPPPIRISLPGMCYRYEQITSRSEIQFNQVEGLAVGENITFSDLKGTLNDFARRMFGQRRQRAAGRAVYDGQSVRQAKLIAIGADVRGAICAGLKGKGMGGRRSQQVFDGDRARSRPNIPQGFAIARLQR